VRGIIDLSQGFMIVGTRNARLLSRIQWRLPTGAIPGLHAAGATVARATTGAAAATYRRGNAAGAFGERDKGGKYFPGAFLAMRAAGCLVLLADGAQLLKFEPATGANILVYRHLLQEIVYSRARTASNYRPESTDFESKFIRQARAGAAANACGRPLQPALQCG
jgi:hypothetical protein